MANTVLWLLTGSSSAGARMGSASPLTDPERAGPGAAGREGHFLIPGGALRVLGRAVPLDSPRPGLHFVARRRNSLARDSEAERMATDSKTSEVAPVADVVGVPVAPKATRAHHNPVEED